MSELAERFARLFEGRIDAHGGDNGACLKHPDLKWDEWVKGYVYPHLAGTGEPIGVYPQLELGVVHWGCIDYDDENAATYAANTTRLAQRLGLTLWLERSRSKGYHLWLLLEEWVPAATVRNALLATQQALGIPPKEINPKQASLAPGQFGNYVRLPYPGGLFETPERQVVVDEGGAIWLGAFLDDAEATLNSLEAVERVAGMVQPEPEVVHVAVGEPTGDALELSRYLRGLSFTIWKHGPLDGADRSGTLFKLAHKLAADGMSPANALVLLRDADLRWGKFHTRADGDEVLVSMIDKAYG